MARLTAGQLRYQLMGVAMAPFFYMRYVEPLNSYVEYCNFCSTFDPYN